VLFLNQSLLNPLSTGWKTIPAKMANKFMAELSPILTQITYSFYFQMGIHPPLCIHSSIGIHFYVEIHGTMAYAVEIDSGRWNQSQKWKCRIEVEAVKMVKWRMAIILAIAKC
jgi:hypothetical protein